MALAYYGTHGHTLKTAKFRPVFVTSTNKLTFRAEKHAARWTGRMSVHGLPGVVVARNLMLPSSGVLSRASVQEMDTLVSTLSHATVDTKK